MTNFSIVHEQYLSVGDRAYVGGPEVIWPGAEMAAAARERMEMVAEVIQMHDAIEYLPTGECFPGLYSPLMTVEDADAFWTMMLLRQTTVIECLPHCDALGWNMLIPPWSDLEEYALDVCCAASYRYLRSRGVWIMNPDWVGTVTE
ncbi:hypothetical protein LCGC14_2262460 [marine sediment metagenome]|uniref:Uncharacterized protein n=1 Tax=marine sediment metagenome TaxID=412755 RepID=A0A0F9DLM3_9ZZZZ